jgi:hypothetical protein
VKRRLALLGVAVMACLIFTRPLSASALLYGDGAIADTYTGAWNIGGTSWAEDSFTLTGPLTLTTAEVGLWSSINDGTPSSLEWRICTSSQCGTPIASGLGTLSDTFFATGYYPEYDVYESAFSLGRVSLPAGTYWLQLGGGTSSGGDHQLLWDINNGPSAAYASDVGGASTAGQCGVGLAVSCSDSFEIYGSRLTATPEPGTLTLIGTFMAVAALLRRNRRHLRQVAGH